MLGKQTLRYVQSIVEVDAYQVGVERCVVKLGKRQAIRNDGLSQLLVLIGNDVCGVEQLLFG